MRSASEPCTNPKTQRIPGLTLSRMAEKDPGDQELASKKMKRNLTYEDPKISQKKKKKKKGKKLKKEKLNKKNLSSKGQGLQDDSIHFTQKPEIKKKKKKDITQDCPLLPTQRKKSNLSKCPKQKKDKIHADAQKFKSVVKTDVKDLDVGQHERSAQREYIQHKRTVMFKLSPEEFLTIPKPDPTFYTQSYSTDKSHSHNTMFSGNRRHSRSPFGDNGATMEFPSTPEYIDSQDLFITQKFFSVPQEDNTSPSTDENVGVPSNQHSIQHREASQEIPSCKQTADASVQTENFFTSPGLANSLRFRHQRDASIATEEPMDLSLPKRTGQKVCLDQCVSKQVEPQSSSELKITDPTSSDESDITSKSRADLSHLKVVQTRLNESFFFKVKGEGESPKARSPLMMLTGSADKKLKK